MSYIEVENAIAVRIGGGIRMVYAKTHEMKMLTMRK